VILDPWARRILTLFAETYPSSAHYRGGRRLRLGSWEKRFPEISGDVDGKDGFLAGVEELVHHGVVAVRWRRFRTGEEVDALFLDDPPKMYEMLQKEAPWDRRDALLEALAEPPWDDPRLADLADRTRARLSAHHPLAIEAVEDLRDIGRLFLLTPRECTGLAIRALSVRLFHDSKRLEALLPRADAFMNEAEGEKVSRRLGLARTYPEVSFALYGSIQWSDRGERPESLSAGGEHRRWRASGEIVTLPGESLPAVDSVSVGAPVEAGASTSRGAPAEPAAPISLHTPWILTVENKESFYVAVAAMRDGWADAPAGGTSTEARNPPSMVIYAPGHPGETVSALIALAGRSGAPIMHFGDLDPEGLLILQEVAARSGHPVRPFLMNLETYRRYRLFGRNLSDHSLSRLKEVTHPDLIPLAGEIRRCRVGVEQEVLPLSFRNDVRILR